MDRRKFLSLGGLLSVAGATTGLAVLEDDDLIPRFEDGQLLSSADLNRLVDRLNDLSRKG